MQRIYLVTGASGYIGSEVCRQLLKAGCKVRAFSRRKATRRYIPEGAEIVAGNILDADSIERLFNVEENSEIYVIHCAAKISVRKHDEAGYVTNVEGTRNIINACIAHNAVKLIYIGSVDALYNPGGGATIYEPREYFLASPLMDYARSKCDASALVMKANKKGLYTTILMPSCVIGPGDYNDGLVTGMFKSFIKGMPPISISGGYDFVDVRDVAKGIILASEKAPSGSSYILSGHYRSVTEIFNIMAEGLNKPEVKLTLPANLLYTAVPLVSGMSVFTGKEPALTMSSVQLLASEAVFSHAKAERELGYTIRPIRKTVYDTLEFIIKTTKH